MKTVLALAMACVLSACSQSTPQPKPQFIGYGNEAISKIRDGSAAPNSQAQARNNAPGYKTTWSNTPPR